MTTIVQLLAQKQKLIERLDEIPDPKERAQIERLFAEIDKDLNLLDAEPGRHWSHIHHLRAKAQHSNSTSASRANPLAPNADRAGKRSGLKYVT